MRVSEFKKLIREEIRRILKENTIQLGNGKVIKNVSVDSNGITLDTKKIPINALSQAFSIKPNNNKAFLELLKASKTLLTLVIEKDLGIIDDEGFNDVLSKNKPLQAKYLKIVEPKANPQYWSLDIDKLPLPLKRSIKRSVLKLKGKSFKGDYPELTSFASKYSDFSKYKVIKDYKWILSFFKQDSSIDITIEFLNPEMYEDTKVVKFLKKFELE
jgi:hypothetical protein